jgi:hypothetical protein
MLIYLMAIRNILRTLWIFFTIWYNLCAFGTFFPVLVYCAMQKLATLNGGGGDGSREEMVEGVWAGHVNRLKPN